MLKKIVWRIFLTGLIGLLIVGVVNRTQANSLFRGEETETSIQDWIPWEGTVESVDENTLTLTDPDGETVEVSGQSWSYALEQGFSAERGDQIELQGSWETEDRFEAGLIVNRSSGQMVRLHTETGQPGWAGRSRGGGGRGGQGGGGGGS